MSSFQSELTRHTKKQNCATHIQDKKQLIDTTPGGVQITDLANRLENSYYKYIQRSEGSIILISEQKRSLKREIETIF